MQYIHCIHATGVQFYSEPEDSVWCDPVAHQPAPEGTVVCAQFDAQRLMGSGGEATRLAVRDGLVVLS